MPAFLRRDDHCALFLEPERGERLGLRLLRCGGFDGLALTVEPVEFGGDSAGLDLVLKEQELGPHRGIADPSSGVDAWSDQKAELVTGRRSLGPCAVEQGAQAGPTTGAHHRKAA